MNNRVTGTLKGNQNAAKGRGSKLHSPINPSLKALCVKLLAEGETLADLVEQALAKEAILRDPAKADEFGVVKLLQKETEVKPKLPLWTRGLSERTANCLLEAGFGGKVAVRAARREGFDFPSLPNFGPRCMAELSEWLGET